MKTFTEKMMIFIAQNELFWDIQWDENLRFFVICNDMFGPGADAEEITEDDFPLLDELVGRVAWIRQFCARKRNLL